MAVGEEPAAGVAGVAGVAGEAGVTLESLFLPPVCEERGCAPAEDMRTLPRSASSMI